MVFIATFLSDESPSNDEAADEPVITLHSNKLEEIERVQAENIETNEMASGVEKGANSIFEKKNKAKVSTGCGPSPDREIEEIFANERFEHSMKSFTPLRDIPSRSSKVSIGTSPPPQAVSTQVQTK